MLTVEEYTKGAKERGIPEETINRVLTTKFKTKPYSQPLEAMASQTGIFDVPVLGGLLRNTVSAPESLGRMVGSDILHSTPFKPSSDPFMSSQERQYIDQNPQERVGRGLNVALMALSPGLKNALPYLSKGLVGREIGNLFKGPLGQQLTTGGKVIENLSKTGERTGVVNQSRQLLGNFPEFTQGTRQTLRAGKTGLDSQVSLQELHGISRKIYDEFGKKVYSAQPGDKVYAAQQLRIAINETIKELEPAFRTPFNMYSLYSKNLAQLAPKPLRNAPVLGGMLQMASPSPASILGTLATLGITGIAGPKILQALGIGNQGGFGQGVTRIE